MLKSNLQLPNGSRCVLLRIHSLSVQNGRQWHKASFRIHQLLQKIQAHPQVVCVEELVLRDVLEHRLIRLGALRRLSQD